MAKLWLALFIRFSHDLLLISISLRDDQVLNKQQSISSSTSTGATRATSPSPDSSSQDTKPPSPAEARAAGRKRALLCGVTNKADPENHLRGSVNDVNRIKEMLIKKQFGYPNNDECIRVLIGN